MLWKKSQKNSKSFSGFSVIYIFGGFHQVGKIGTRKEMKERVSKQYISFLVLQKQLLQVLFVGLVMCSPGFCL